MINARNFANRAAAIALVAVAALSSAPAKADLFSDLFGGGYSRASYGYTPRAGYTPRSYASYDRGGSVLDYYDQIRAANVSRQTVAIDGYCASACTMKLGARHACVTPDATLRFHSASAYGSTSRAGNTLLMSMYPRNIRNWVARHSALASLDFTEMSGAQAIALGVRAC